MTPYEVLEGHFWFLYRLSRQQANYCVDVTDEEFEATRRARCVASHYMNQLFSPVMISWANLDKSRSEPREQKRFTETARSEYRKYRAFEHRIENLEIDSYINQ